MVRAVDREDVDAVRREVLPGSVGGVDLDAEGQEVAREAGQSLAVGDREEGSHPAGTSVWARRGASRADLRRPGRRATFTLRRPSIARDRGILGRPIPWRPTGRRLVPAGRRPAEEAPRP